MEKLMTQQQLCDYLQVEVVFLWRMRCQGMPYIRLGTKAVRYKLDDVLAWLNDQNEKRVG